MNIAIRVDSGFYIGIGHLVRCLNFVENFNKNDKIIFICKDHYQNRTDLIPKKYQIFLLNINKNVNFNINTWLGSDYQNDVETTIDIIKNKNIDLLIIDHYNIDHKWEMIIEPYVKKIMVIDDLQNRRHECDILLDQNIMDNKYDKLLPNNCIKMIGLKYSLINHKFIEMNQQEINKKDKVIISFGGVDNHNISTKIYYFLKENNHLFKNKSFHFISNNLYNNLTNHNNFYFYPTLSLDSVIELIKDAYLAIGASGISIYERMALGIYSIVITIADNQIEIAKKIDELGYGKYLGHYDNINYEGLMDILNNKIKCNKILFKKDHYNNIIKNVKSIIDMSTDD